MRTKKRALLAVPCAALLLLAACGSDDTTTDADDTAAPAEREAERETERTTDTSPDEMESDLESMDIDEVVQYGAFEYEIQDLEVDDEDAETRGIELVFNTSVTNTTDSSATPHPSLSLIWDDGSDVVQISGVGDFREIPSDSSSRATIEFSVTPDDMDTWDMDSARLVFGDDNSAQAEVPLGDDAELITRLPIEQDIDDEIILGNFSMEIVESMVRWDYSANQQLDDGNALLVIVADVANDTENQICLDTSDFSLTLPDNTSRTMDEVTERCFSEGESVRDVAMVFEIEDPFAGDYELTAEAGRGDDEAMATITFTLEEGGDTITSDDDDDDDEDDDEDEDDDFDIDVEDDDDDDDDDE